MLRNSTPDRDGPERAWDAYRVQLHLISVVPYFRLRVYSSRNRFPTNTAMIIRQGP
jgi:hypothetical protein